VDDDFFFEWQVYTVPVCGIQTVEREHKKSPDIIQAFFDIK